MERLVQECEDEVKSLAREEGQRLGARQLAWPWSLIFTDGIWLEEVMAMFPEENGPVPVLLCHELRKTHLVSGRFHASLIVNDWHGDVQYLKPKLFRSLRQGKYNKNRSEMTFKINGLTVILELCDTLHSREEIRFYHPRKIFQRDDKTYFTYAVYYGDPTIHRVEVEGVKAISFGWSCGAARVYAIRTRFSNGQGLWRGVNGRRVGGGGYWPAGGDSDVWMEDSSCEEASPGAVL
jgi:hypothetical protein